VTSDLEPADVEAIERATVAAVVPDAVEEIAGWLLGFDAGTVGRAKSAAPLSHRPAAAASADGIVDAIVARYAARGLPAVIRLPVVPGLDAVRDALGRRGLRPGPATLVQVARTVDACRMASPDGVHLADRPDAAWTSAFLGEGFDPVDGASRARSLARSTDTMFASVREEPGPGMDAAVAIGAGAVSFGYGWAGIHGMRTARARRGQGIAGRILTALARVASDRGVHRLFLQVEAANAPALALYRRAGFVTAWRYEYWTAGPDADTWRAAKPRACDASAS